MKGASAIRALLARGRVARRASQFRSSSTQTPGPKPVSPHVGFYKTFTKPVTKVLLMAVLTYQLAYLGWMKLEKDEIKGQKQAEIDVLEKKLAELTDKTEKSTTA